MDVEAAVLGCVEDCLRQDEAVGDDDRDLGLVALEGGEGLVGLE